MEKRIKAIEPRWNGQFLPSSITQTVSPEAVEPETKENEKIAVTAAILSSAEQAISQVGILNEQNIEYVHQLIVAMPLTVRKAAQDAYSARALIIAMLISQQKDRDAALAVLADGSDPDIQVLSLKLVDEVEKLDERFKLPLLELAVNALKEMSPNQFVQFKTRVDALIRSDKVVNLNEWIIQRFVVQQLDGHFGFRKLRRAKYDHLESLRDEAAVILSLIAIVEHDRDEECTKAFDAGSRMAGLAGLKIVPRKGFKLESLNGSLDKLVQLKPLEKPRLLKACVAVIMDDEKTTTKGMELVRTLSSCLDCPMPPMTVSRADATFSK